MGARWRVMGAVSIAAASAAVSVGLLLTREAPAPPAARDDAPPELRVLGRWARRGASETDLRCFGADGTCTPWSWRESPRDAREVARWRLARSYGNTLVAEITEQDGDLLFSREVALVINGDELRDGAIVFERVEGRVEHCGAE